MRLHPLLLGAALLAGGCDLVKSNWDSEASISLDRDRMAAGQTIEVTFDKLHDDDGRLFWIAIQPSESPATDQNGRRPVPKGAQTMRLTAKVPCACEVRVYTESSGGPNMIVARKKLTVLE